jgi:hypothetical protein
MERLWAVDHRLQVCWDYGVLGVGTSPIGGRKGKVEVPQWSGMVWGGGATSHNSGARAIKHTIEADRLNSSTASKSWLMANTAGRRTDMSLDVTDGSGMSWLRALRMSSFDARRGEGRWPE